MVAGEAPNERSGALLHRFRDSPNLNTLGIMSFETAKTMSRLISIYHSVTDDEIRVLKTETVRSVGVKYLNSGDEAFLLGLARSERLEDLDQAAETIARLGSRCSDRSLNRFDLVYSDLKLGVLDSGKVLEFSGRSLERVVAKMERYVANTASLFGEMEGLRSLEAQELEAIASEDEMEETNLELFEEKIGFQRKEVRRLKKVSLWSKSFEKCVSLMSRLVCAVFARIESVLGPEIEPEISQIKEKKHHQFHIHIHHHPHHHHHLHLHLHLHHHHHHRNPKNPTQVSPNTDPDKSPKSGPLHPHENPKSRWNRFWGPDSIHFGFRAEHAPSPPTKSPGSGLYQFCASHNIGPGLEVRPRVYQSAPPTTVGGAGLALRYANLIMLGNRYMHSPLVMDDEQRSLVYEMLPARLRSRVMAKLRSSWALTESEEKEGDGWREAVEGMMAWLVPVAVDTLRWQAERNLGKQNMDSKPTVLLLQTLHYSDLEKTEAVLVEVLVGLSFIFKHENQQTLFQ